MPRILPHLYHAIQVTHQTNGLLRIGTGTPKRKEAFAIKAWRADCARTHPAIYFLLPIRSDWRGDKVRLYATKTPPRGFDSDSGGRLWSWAYVRDAPLVVGLTGDKNRITLVDVPVASVEQIFRWSVVLTMMPHAKRTEFWRDLAHYCGIVPEVATGADMGVHMIFEAWRDDQVATCEGGAMPRFWTRFQRGASAVRLPVDYPPNIGFYLGAFRAVIGGEDLDATMRQAERFLTDARRAKRQD